MKKASDRTKTTLMIRGRRLNGRKEARKRREEEKSRKATQDFQTPVDKKRCEIFSILREEAKEEDEENEER